MKTRTKVTDLAKAKAEEIEHVDGTAVVAIVHCPKSVDSKLPFRVILEDGTCYMYDSIGEGKFQYKLKKQRRIMPLHKLLYMYPDYKIEEPTSDTYVGRIKFGEFYLPLCRLKYLGTLESECPYPMLDHWIEEVEE